MATMLRLPIAGGSGDPDPNLIVKQGSLNSGNNPNLNLVEARDIIANRIAKGGQGMKDDEGYADFKRMSAILGQDKAQKLFTQLSLYNQDGNIKNLPYGDKVAKFYEMGHGNDKDIFDIFQRIKQVGQGVKAGTNDSQYRGVQDAANSSNRIMLKVVKN